MRFVNISLQSSLSLANKRDEVSSSSKSLPHTETEETVELEQSNQELIIESIPTNETLIAKDKIDGINDVATWPNTGCSKRNSALRTFISNKYTS